VPLRHPSCPRARVSRVWRVWREPRPEPPTAPRTGPPRSRPTPPSPTVAQPRPTKPRVGCRRSRRHPHPGPAPATRGPKGSREAKGSRGARGPRAIRPCPGFLDHRGPPPRRPTSGAQVPASGVLPLRRPLGPVGQRVPRAQADSVPAGREAGLTSRAAGRPRRGLPDQVRPGRVRPGPADPVDPGLVPVLRVPARGRATTRSARPRPAWGRRLRPGRRRLVRLVRPARKIVLPVPDSPRALRAVPVAPVGSPVVLVRADGVPAGQAAAPTAVRVLAVRVRAAPGRAR
jgi:hypothetical protein